MILIAPDAHVPRAALPKRELSRFLADACERAGVGGEVTVLITTDEQMQELNRSFRRKNKPTDVLSFPPAPAAFAGQEANGGDLAISLDIARRQAGSLGHTLLVEVKILILHGLLHLSGMDHEQDEGQMGRREARLRREFELPRGLIQRSKAPLVELRPAASATTRKRSVPPQERAAPRPRSVKTARRVTATSAPEALQGVKLKTRRGAKTAAPRKASSRPARASAQ